LPVCFAALEAPPTAESPLVFQPFSGLAGAFPAANSSDWGLIQSPMLV